MSYIKTIVVLLAFVTFLALSQAAVHPKGSLAATSIHSNSSLGSCDTTQCCSYCAQEGYPYCACLAQCGDTCWCFKF